MQYIIPIDLINAILVAECFVKYVFKLYGLLNLIISDYSYTSLGQRASQNRSFSLFKDLQARKKRHWSLADIRAPLLQSQ